MSLHALPGLDIDDLAPAPVNYGSIYYGSNATDPRGAWAIDCVPHVAIKVKRVFARVRQGEGGRIIVRDSPEVARDIEWLIDRYPMTLVGRAAEMLAAGAKKHRDDEDTVARILSGRRLDVDTARVPAIELRDYQRVAADLISTMKRGMNGDALGLGKTFSGLSTLRNPGSLPAACVVPTHLTFQWREQVQRMWPGLTVFIPSKANPLQDRAFDRFVKNNGGQPPDVYVLPYSKLAGWQHHLSGTTRTVLFDEAQELRNGRSTEKGQAAGNIADAAEFVVGLTATPVYNYGGEMHSIYDILSPGALGSREEFLREWGGSAWTQQGGKQVATVADPRALSLHLRNAGLFISRTRADVGRELPYGPAEKVPHLIDSDPKVLEQMQGDAVEMARFILSRSGTAQERFQQSGELDARLRLATGLAKAPFVAAFVTTLLQSTSKVIVWGWHHAVYEVWQERLARNGIRSVKYTGEETPNQKQATLNAFMRDDGPQVLIMSLRSGAGIDGLQERCSVGVFGELDWSPKIMEQCLDAETQVLTRRGFLSRQEINEADEVAGFDRETSAIEWAPIMRIVDRALGDEDMYRLHTNTVDLRVTAGHRMVYRARKRGGGKTAWKVATAAELAARKSYYDIPAAGVQESPGSPLTDDEIRFLGWFFTDGHWDKRSRHVEIGQASTSPYLDDIEKCLAGCGFAYGVYRQRRRTQFSEDSTIVRYYVPKYRSHTRPGRGWNDLEPYLDKDISPHLEALDHRQFSVLLEAMNLGDGNKGMTRDYVRRTYAIGTSRRIAADRLQSLAIRRGWRCNVTEITTPGGKPHFIIRCKPGKTRSYGGYGKPNLVLDKSRPDERVWCIENHLDTLVVRRNGKTAVVGNCAGRLARDGQEAQVLTYYLLARDGADPKMAEVLELKHQQATPIEDPRATLVASMPQVGNRVRLLAEDLLRQHGIDPDTLTPDEG